MMQNILNRIAKASQAQTKLNKAKKPSKSRKVAFGLAQDLDALASELQRSVSGISVDITSEVRAFNNAVSALENALSQYKQLEVALNNFLEVQDEFLSAAESLGLEPDDKYESLITEVADTFDRGEEVIDLEESANKALRLIEEFPIPFM